MPRKPRMYVAGMPCHVIQRGNNREACFFAEEDYLFYLECLRSACKRYHVACHAYVLMTNHTHLLLTPETVEGVSQVMQSLGRRYVQYINKLYRRSGTLWEGRHKASLVDAENYLLNCYRYVELNPVRANMVAHPGDYGWSSYQYNAFGKHSRIITEHAVYTGLSDNGERRQVLYRELFSMDLPKPLIHEIRTAANFSMPLGSSRFKMQVEKALSRKIGQVKRGRPRKTK